MLTAVLDRIAGRVQKRVTGARERIEDAAKRLAAGEAVDEAGVEASLFEAGIDVEEFRKMAVFYGERRQRLELLNTLGAARAARKGRPGHRGREQAVRRTDGSVSQAVLGAAAGGRRGRRGSRAGA